MLQSANNWEIFGFDVRNLGKEWRAAWRNFLWAYDSPVKSRLDEVVSVHSESGTLQYQGLDVINANASLPSQCDAVMLPEDLVLAKTLEMPASVELDLDSVMVYEVLANSPFPENDTGYGWRLVEKQSDHIVVQLAVVSLSATLAYLERQYNIHNIHSREVWVSVGDLPITLKGFGEARRDELYLGRLKKSAAMLAYCCVMVVFLGSALTMAKFLELEQYRVFASEVQERSKSASTMRESVLRANDAVNAIKTLQAENPNPHLELARLTRLLSDDAYLESLSMTGRDLRIRGRAANAAEIMEMLNKEPAYGSVTAPQAIVKTPDGQERFTLSISLSGGAGS